MKLLVIHQMSSIIDNHVEPSIVLDGSVTNFLQDGDVCLITNILVCIIVLRKIVPRVIRA